MTDCNATPPDDNSGRGFTHLPRVPSAYGGTTRVYESSAASAPHIWLATECPEDLNKPDGPTIEAVSHLTVENALVLADQIVHLVASHSQIEHTAPTVTHTVYCYGQQGHDGDACRDCNWQGTHAEGEAHARTPSGTRPAGHRYVMSDIDRGCMFCGEPREHFIHKARLAVTDAEVEAACIARWGEASWPPDAESDMRRELEADDPDAVIYDMLEDIGTAPTVTDECSICGEGLAFIHAKTGELYCDLGNEIPLEQKLTAKATPTVTDAEVDAAICAAAEHDGFNPNGLTLDGPESEKTRKMLEAAARARPSPTVTDAAQEAAQAAGRAYGWDEDLTAEEYADAILDIIQVAARARQENTDD